MSRKICKRKQYVNPYLQNARCEKLRKAIRDYRIWFYLLDDGEKVFDGLSSIYLMTCVVARVLDPDTPDARKIKSAIGILAECTERGTWRKADLQTVNNALDIVLNIYPALAANDARHAINEEFAA